MDKALEKLLEHSGYATPFMYAGLAYALFHWLDEKASDEAKAALARTMSLKDYNQSLSARWTETRSKQSSNEGLRPTGVL